MQDFMQDSGLFRVRFRQLLLCLNSSQVLSWYVSSKSFFINYNIINM